MPIHDWTKVYAELCHDFHQSWSIRIKDALNAGVLPKGMSALVEQKTPRRETDVLAVDYHEPGKSPGAWTGGTVTLEAPRARIIRKSTKESYADKANRIVVKHKLGRTIAVVEIVSPGNKDGKEAFKEFLDKSLEFIRKGIHLLVVDLFPPTKRDPFGVHRAIWDNFEEDDDEFTFPEGTNRILASYNAGRTKEAYAEPVAVGDAMPDMPLFLFGEYHVQVPLESTYQETWSVMNRDLQEYVKTGVLPGTADEAEG